MYETKALLMAISEAVRHLETKEEIFKALVRIANVEGVIIEPLELTESKKES